MNGTGKTIRVGLGVVGGLLWFLTLSAAAVLQQDAVATGGSAVGAVVLAAVVSGLCALGFQVWRVTWGVGVSAAMAACLLLGLIEGPLPPGQAPSQLLSVPATFSVGLGSLAVWVAFTVAVTLSVAAAHRGVPSPPASSRAREPVSS